MKKKLCDTGRHSVGTHSYEASVGYRMLGQTGFEPISGKIQPFERMSFHCDNRIVKKLMCNENHV